MKYLNEKELDNIKGGGSLLLVLGGLGILLSGMFVGFFESKGCSSK